MVDQGIETAELFHRRLDDGCPILLRGDVMPQRESARSFARDLRRNRLGLGVSNVGQDQLRAFARERAGTGDADAGRRTRHNGDLAGNPPCHRQLLRGPRPNPLQHASDLSSAFRQSACKPRKIPQLALLRILRPINCFDPVARCFGRCLIARF